MNVLRFDSEAACVAGVAAFWRDRLRQSPSLTHCLASGNTPIPVYREMSRSVRAGQVSFKNARVFALDEFGGLAPDDPGRCHNMLWRDLIGPVEMPKAQFHFLNPEAKDLEMECRAYDQAIGRGFDLVLLGIGMNGHLGMNEPGSAPDSNTRRIDLHESTIRGSAAYLTHANLPKWGLTVGMKQFFGSSEVWLMATGSKKAEIVSRVVKGQVSEQVPASLMHRHSNCSLFVDQAAGALL